VRKHIASLLAIVLLTTPLATIAQQQTVNPCQKAHIDAKQDFNMWTWLGAGCVLNILGVGLAYALKPTPSPSNLIGKPPSYIASYTDCYVRESKKLRAAKAWIGCGVAGGLLLIGSVILAAVTAQEIGNSCGNSMGTACGNSASSACTSGSSGASPSYSFTH